MFSLLGKLAFDGIKKNKRLYIPYIMTGTIVIMMFYILLYIANSKTLAYMPASTFLALVLPLGIIVIFVFSLIFLFYTNSFLIKQRYKEFGLYSILGMNKTNINILMLMQNVMVFLFALVSGLVFGIAFSKMAELIIISLTNEAIDFKLSVSFSSLFITAATYVIVYSLLYVNSIIKVTKAKPIDLLSSERRGEKKPKNNYFLALLGLIFLILAYFLAIYYSYSIIVAVFTFFIAVIFVIIATYLLFIAGSTALCHILKNNKNYYYKPNHFISISSLSFRMKRNGAGLASICILLTMVLVMISSTSSLYFGLEDNLEKRYPGDVNYTNFYPTYEAFVSDDQTKYLENTNASVLSTIKYIETSGAFREYGINNSENNNNATSDDYMNTGYLYAISTEEYNRLSGNDLKIQDSECLIYTNSLVKFKYTSFKTEYSKTYQVVGYIDKFISNHAIYDYELAQAIIVINDLESFYKQNNQATEYGNISYLKSSTDCLCDNQEELAAKLKDILTFTPADEVFKYQVVTKDRQKTALLGLYSSMMFLGIMLSFVFILATILIIYYKQISEGHEDKQRFDIMQKVGLDKKMIRKSINSQMLTVFFSPLILSGIHLSFAFPFIWSMLNMFGFSNMKLIIIVTLICYLVCAFMYVLTYKFTSYSYYQIVSNE